MEQHLSDIAFILSFAALSFIVGLVGMPPFIRLLKYLKIQKQLRDEALGGGAASIFRELHAHKKGTPTAGGIMIWSTVLIMVAVSFIPQILGVTNFSLFNRAETWLPLFTLVTAGLLGLIDDWYNITGRGTGKGLHFRPKLIWLTIFAALGAWWFAYKLGYNAVELPFLGNFSLPTLALPWLGDVPIMYMGIFIFVMIATANAVNFTDGLDGLAGGLLAIAFGSYAVIAYSQGLFLLATLCAAVAGALVAFLWFNVPPASIFMGDTGSYGLGAMLGVMAMLTGTIIPFVLISGVFIVETLSVIVQLASKRWLGRKLFLIAPLHHHLEKLGWPEHQITMRFWLIGGVLAGLGVVLALAGAV